MSELETAFKAYCLAVEKERTEPQLSSHIRGHGECLYAMAAIRF
jgi:hypothetical protein